MPVSFRILPRQYLIYLRYHGVLAADDNIRVFGKIVAHPDFRKGMRALVDLTDIDGWDPDYLAIMRFGAREAEVHDDPAQPTVVVCLAPNDTTRRIAQIINRTWEGSERKVTVTVDTEPEALAVLGIGVPSIAALLQSA
ncbi:MAG: hypothetical protein KDK08_10270 [Rhizobiaceae bacterium]|nr:hypothetical protein [Rhizobiaceae bacterium]